MRQMILLTSQYEKHCITISNKDKKDWYFFLTDNISVTKDKLFSADFGYFVYALWFNYSQIFCFSILSLFTESSQNVKLFGFPIFRFWVYLMKVIPETRLVH